MALVLVLAAGAALFSLAAAAASAVAFREASAERALLRHRLREIGERLDGVERAAGQAAAQARVASQLLVEKGIADEEDLEAVRRLVYEPGTGGDARSADETVH